MKKNNIFTHKFLPILGLVFFILFILLINNSFASNDNFYIDEDVKKAILSIDGFNSETMDFFIGYSTGYDYYFCTIFEKNESSIFYYYQTGGMFPHHIRCQNNWIHVINYKYIDGIFVYQDESSIRNNNDLISTDASDGIYYFCSSVNVYTGYGSSDLFYEGETISNPYDIILSTGENTNNPVIAYTNYFLFDDYKRYECYISTDLDNWTLMNYETFKDTSTNTTYFRFNYTILENGTYYFKFVDKKTNTESYITRDISNILKNSTNSGYTPSGIPQPFITYERVGEYFVLKTQSFTEDEILRYKCLYTNSFSEDYYNWSNMSIGSLNNTQLGQTEYFFFISLPLDSENCTYYFVFYDYNKQEYGYFSSLQCDFQEMNEYSDKVDGVIKEEKNRFEELLNFFKERFGFLTYPFEFIADLLNRILNINYSEPIIHIPEIYCPGTDIKIFDGYDYNFNTLLENNAISNIYNIYLIAVDFFIVLGVVTLSYKTLMEVFGNG